MEDDKYFELELIERRHKELMAQLNKVLESQKEKNNNDVISALNLYAKEVSNCTKEMGNIKTLIPQQTKTIVDFMTSFEKRQEKLLDAILMVLTKKKELKFTIERDFHGFVTSINTKQLN